MKAVLVYLAIVVPCITIPLLLVRSSRRKRRERWINEVAQLLALKHGDSEPNENLRIHARNMAHYYYDELISEGMSPESPKEAVNEEMAAGS